MMHDPKNLEKGFLISQKNLSLKEILKLQLVQERLNLPPAESRQLLEMLKRDAEKILGVPSEKLVADVDFSGPEMDLVFSFPAAASKGSVSEG